MKKMLGLFFGFLLCLPLLFSYAFAGILPPRGEGQIGYEAVVLCESLTIRRERSTSSEAVGILKYGDTFICSQSWDGWCDCFLSEAEGTGSAGWVLSDYVIINPSRYMTDASTPVYAWADSFASKVALLDRDTELPIIREEEDWVLVSLRGAAGWIRKTPRDKMMKNPVLALQPLQMAELITHTGVYTVDTEDALTWLQHHFSLAEPLAYTPSCPFDAVLILTDCSGQRITLKTASDSCNYFMTEDGLYFSYGDPSEGSPGSRFSEALYGLFGLTFGQSNTGR